MFECKFVLFIFIRAPVFHSPALAGYTELIFRRLPDVSPPRPDSWYNWKSLESSREIVKVTRAVFVILQTRTICCRSNMFVHLDHLRYKLYIILRVCAPHCGAINGLKNVFYSTNIPSGRYRYKVYLVAKSSLPAVMASSISRNGSLVPSAVWSICLSTRRKSTVRWNRSFLPALFVITIIIVIHFIEFLIQRVGIQINIEKSENIHEIFITILVLCMLWFY